MSEHAASAEARLSPFTLLAEPLPITPSPSNEINTEGRLYRSVSLDALSPASEPFSEMTEEVLQDYTLYEKIVSSLNLTENMRIALECRQNGLSYPEIGRVLSRAQATVYEYFIKMRQRYMAIYS